MIDNPRHKYDCDSCKFNWNCGILCGCVKRNLPEPPERFQKAIDLIQNHWRKARKGEDERFGTDKVV